MFKTMEQVQWGYITGSNETFDQYKVSFGRSLSSNETVTLVKTLTLMKNANNQLYLSNSDGNVGHTSAIVKEEWIENFCIGDKQIALVKCFETKSGSRYIFAPMFVL